MTYNVWVYYPMPFKDDVDESLREYEGWYGSGVNLIDDIRDNSIKVSDVMEIASLAQIIPSDGHMRVWPVV
jgi:hypothetical protein